MRISVSGFNQEIYKKAHRRGNIDKVKRNLVELREMLDETKSDIHVEVVYHMYNYNVGEDLDLMREYCDDLGFRFNTVWAYLMPIEKVLNYYDGKVTEEDQEVLDSLAVPMLESREISLRSSSADCHLRALQTTINADGSVGLCCAVYDPKYNISKSFLETDHKKLQELKYRHRLCKRCMNHGYHRTAICSDVHKWNKIASENVPDLPADRVQRENLRWRLFKNFPVRLYRYLDRAL
jgi:hypothetical protein